MSIVQEFKYFKPRSMKEALELLTRQKGAVVLAGGTDLVCNLKDRLISPKAVIDIKGIAGLTGIILKGKRLTIGALVTFSDLVKSEVIREHFPLISEMARTVGSVAIRNRATVVGNICSAVPCMDSAPVLCVYDAEVHVSGSGVKRTIPVSKWFRGSRKTAIKKAEIVTGISLLVPAEKHGGCFVKQGRYAGEDLAQSNVALLALPGNQYRVSFGSVAPVPIRARKIEKALNGKPLDHRQLTIARDLVPEEISPITDIRSTMEYRMHMCKVMFERGINAAVQRLNGTGPAYGTSLI